MFSLTLAFAAATACGYSGGRGHVTSSNVEGSILQELPDGSVIERLVGEDKECDFGHVTTVDEDGVTPAANNYLPMSVLCPSSLAETRRYFENLFSVRSDDIDGYLDLQMLMKQYLASAGTGDVRELAAYLGYQETTAILTITKAEGELLPPTRTATHDYIREYTLTAEVDCAALPEAGCEGKWTMSLTGRQTEEEISPYTDGLFY